MKRLYDLVSANENWLVERAVRYAKERGYADYTATLPAAWRMAIQGLSRSFLAALESDPEALELGPHIDYRRDPVAAFGILEAQRHRKRGVDLAMFLGL
ncbi:MAG: hypothetical protein QHJ73_13360, partial [Armatimonadota bacterium]|nr:hypothetical protein [Armatimonadota bacterium]